MNKSRFLIIAFLSLGLSLQTNAHTIHADDSLAAQSFLNLFEKDSQVQQESLTYLRENWSNKYVSMALDVVFVNRDPWVRENLLKLVQRKTRQNIGLDLNGWYKWLWNRPESTIEGYADFKAALYKRIDPLFEQYFKGRGESDIRLDEVQWGGVKQDGIPPLRNPEMISAEEATFLEDDNVVFGISVNGDVRAYPKRILAWHEMFVDEVGGLDLAGVYCTLCGTVILYNTTYDGVNHQVGTSGFLYRSNKLMYDKATQSLWNTLWGTPVIGPLRGKGIELEKLSVVTTTWGEWKRRHPETTVLSLRTGHRRDYGEGVAYKDYFATDRLMFATPFDDPRLKNKQEVLALKFPEYPRGQLAISTKFLQKKPVYQNSLGKIKFVVFTDPSGANRVYEAKEFKFKSFDGKDGIVDKEGRSWKLYEDHIMSEDGTKLQRLPYHRAFWFGWKAAYPNTKLIR